MTNYVGKLAPVIAQCIAFIATDPLDECLKASYSWVEIYEDGEAFLQRAEDLYANHPDRLDSRILRQAVASHGIFMFYAAFLFLSGNPFAADLRCRDAELRLQKVSKELTDLINKPMLDDDDISDYDIEEYLD